MLREDGFDVEVATDGATAIARLTRLPLPDILVTDFKMPHADGEAVSRFGRTQRPGLPVFIVTSYPGMVTKTRLGEPPPVLFTKPVDYVDLRDEIVRVLGPAGAAPPSGD
jgi:two-component system response regulator MprA